MPFLGLDDVPAGCFVAAVGADNPAKSEIKPELMARATVVVDVLEQCLVMGDLHHAVVAGALRAEAVHADLGQIVIGAKPGREAANEIIIFDSTGTAAQDVTAAIVAYDRALERGGGKRVALGAL